MRPAVPDIACKAPLLRICPPVCCISRSLLILWLSVKNSPSFRLRDFCDSFKTSAFPRLNQCLICAVRILVVISLSPVCSRGQCSSKFSSLSLWGAWLEWTWPGPSASWWSLVTGSHPWDLRGRDVPFLGKVPERPVSVFSLVLSRAKLMYTC